MKRWAATSTAGRVSTQAAAPLAEHGRWRAISSTHHARSEPSYIGGVIDRDPETWEDLCRVLVTSQTTGWIFRGQEDFDWKLSTRLERELSRWPEEFDPGTKYAVETEVINTFIAKARHRLSIAPEDDLLGWLSVMQHYGAPTRLLDWTRSPFVACYFAYAGSDEKDAALWLLNEPMCRIAHGNQNFGTSVGFAAYTNEYGQPSMSLTREGWLQQEDCRIQATLYQEEWPLVVIPTIVDERIRAQQGLFTFHGSLCALNSDCPTTTLWRVPNKFGLSLADPRQDLDPDVALWKVTRNGSGPRGFVRKVRLRAAWRRQALRVLQGMNITSDVLFPGLDGIGRAATLQIQCGDVLGNEKRRLQVSRLLDTLDTEHIENERSE